MSAKYAANPFYVEHERQLLRLHELIAAGDSESDAADAIRDAMDETWWKLSQDEQDHLAQLSGDLYLLQGSEAHEFPKNQADANEIGSKLSAALRHQRWDEVLDLLRTRPADIPASLVSRVRALSYRQLGDLPAATAFAMFSIQKDPTNSKGRFLALDLLDRNGRVEEALELGLRLRSDSADDLIWLTRYVSILLEAGEPQRRISYWRHVRAELQRSLINTDTARIRKKVLVFANISMVICSMIFEDWQSVRLWYSQALQLSRDDADSKALLLEFKDALEFADTSHDRVNTPAVSRLIPHQLLTECINQTFNETFYATR